MVCFIAVVVAIQAPAGERMSIRGLGMAHTYIGMAKGLDAVGINPADLDVEDATVSFSLMSAGVHAGSDFLSYGLYTKYFTGVPSATGNEAKYLTDADKNDILNSFPRGGGVLDMDAEARPFGIALKLGIGSMAATVTEVASVSLRVPSDYVRFLFFGNQPNSMYDFSQSKVQAWWLREYALTFATTLEQIQGLPELSLGIAVKLVHGYGYADLERFDSKFVTSSNGMLYGSINMRSRTAGIDPIAGSQRSPYAPFPAPAGVGYGLDIGASAKLSPGVRVGMSITDIGAIVWTRNIREAVAETTLVVDDPLDQEKRDQVERALEGKSGPGGSFKTPLPTTIRTGVSFELRRVEFLGKLIPGEMTVGCDLSQIVFDVPGSFSGTRLSCGAEWRPWTFLPLRTGISMGGSDHQNFALGLGIHAGFFAFDIASENLGWLLSPDNFSYASVSAGFTFRF